MIKGLYGKLYFRLSKVNFLVRISDFRRWFNLLVVQYSTVGSFDSTVQYSRVILQYIMSILSNDPAVLDKK